MRDIEEITPAQALARQAAGRLLIDVREPGEHALGLPEGALAVPRAALEAEPGRWAADPAAEVLLICGSGKRSLLAAQALAAAGYARPVSVSGGFERWRAEGLPEMPGAREDADFLERYSRHLRLPQVGLDGQRRLAEARVLVVGAGGLGSPAAYYLAAAGVGTLVLADDDVVDRSNLQRQILHTEARIGVAKVESARTALSALNPRLAVETAPVRVTADNVEALVRDVDVVLDGADNFPVRYLLSDACVLLGKPLVYGAVHRFEGQVSVFDAGRRRGEAPCYRCLFPEPPAPEDAPNCAEAGVLGVLPGVIGLLQATEVLKLILGLGDSLAGRLLHFDALRMRFRETRLAPDPGCPACAPGRRLGVHDSLSPACRVTP
ncbi:molybdopterin-synthase adenylyltransferase MoeB [Arenimonas terrae]|jgi:molybdopterin/thiamine biosynthesis adenylyltransferase/rhodanese-related sulfurtransferase|uniref:Molybdopterin-synthase adenylyltransferase n=1 Tax=Arenimonas terrae TaxID=2546226 RepID=A0A5C4RUV2_9GAMM|nr:molybdopterin-synthase adenylyltransferase MoeB [Arenimonas terrae]TNJ34641.1 molybdopterin-synthase adenylyltransferase MoeB [Arenimonas terrae]